MNIIVVIIAIAISGRTSFLAVRLSFFESFMTLDKCARKGSRVQFLERAHLSKLVDAVQPSRRESIEKARRPHLRIAFRVECSD